MKKKTFFILLILVITFFSLEILYLRNQNKHFNEKLSFVKLTKITNFAFYSNTYYIRHQNSSKIQDIYTYHPAFRESKIATFIYSGMAKKYE